MKKIYLVSFPIGNSWQSNIVLSDSIQSVINHYGKYGRTYVTEGNKADLKEAKKKKDKQIIKL